MKSVNIAYQIAQVLYYKYGLNKSLSEEQIEEEISVIAGDDQRTLRKYKDKMEKSGYIIATSLPPKSTWKIPIKPKRPLKASEYIDLLRVRHEKQELRV